MPDVDRDPADPVPEFPQTSDDAIPRALARRGRGLSLVWLIPLLAVIIGVWLAAKTLSEQGPTIRISFKTASGLAAGQTKVKFKDVDVGQVTAIDVSEDLKRVVVTAELKHGFSDFLTENTRFWVERPRVTASGISGLDTLLSGSFIALDPGGKGKAIRDFAGLEEPPLFTTAEPGKRYVLRSPTLGSLNIGSPLYYRQIQVGQVVGYALDQDNREVSIEIFISSPHDTLVSANTRFWNASGIDVSLSANGIKVDTQSLLSVLIGGISFDTPDTIDAPAALAADDTVFHLYPSRDDAYAKTYSRKERYLLFFDGSVRGLAIGAPVLLKGIDIGRVLDVQLQFDVADAQFRIPVLIEVEPDRIAVRGDPARIDRNQMVQRLVDMGLRGQLKSSNLLTGDLYLDLDVYPDATRETVARYGEYEVIPTRPAPLDALATKLDNLLGKLDTIPLEQIGRDLAQTIAGANALVNSSALEQTMDELQASLAEVHAISTQINRTIAPELANTLQQTTSALTKANAMLSSNSSLPAELQRTLQEVSGAARSVRLMADYLERHPEALLQGKGKGR